VLTNLSDGVREAKGAVFTGVINPFVPSNQERRQGSPCQGKRGGKLAHARDRTKKGGGGGGGTGKGPYSQKLRRVNG